mgnify:CR=1 FL=1
MSSTYQKLLNNLENLHLDFMREYVPNYIETVNEQEITFTEALLTLTTQELEHQENMKVERVIKRARFPKRTTLAAFDFILFPALNF